MGTTGLAPGQQAELRTLAERTTVVYSPNMSVGVNLAFRVLALMARGVGEDTAARILRGYHESEEDFLRDVLAAEITYARTKRFWD